MDSLLPPGVLQVRSFLVNYYVLRDATGLYLLDAGFIGGRWLLRRALRRRGWENEPVRGIIVTHGHLDHILNVGAIARDTGAWIAAPRLDASHYSGHPKYNGWAHVTGMLEGIGRPVLGFQPFTPGRWLDDGDFIDVWRGLRAVHLPGHTAGHMGFYCEPLRLLFSADLYSSYRFFAHFPPDIFNSNSARIPQSAATALALDLAGVLPHHGNRVPPKEHLRRLQRLHARHSGTKLPPSNHLQG